MFRLLLRTQVQNGFGVQLGEAADRVSGDVRKVVHREPRSLADASQLDDMRVPRLRAVYRLRRKYPPRASAQVPREHDVPLDEAKGHVVGGRVASNVRHQGDLVHEARHEEHGQFEALMDLGWYGVRGERREPADAARKERLADFQVYKTHCRDHYA